MKTRKFKRFIGLLLSIVLLIVLCSNTVLALDAQISTADVVSQTTEYRTNGGCIEADAIIPNPDYVANKSTTTKIENSSSTLSITSTRLVDGVYRIKNVANGKYMDTNSGGTIAGTAIVQWDKSEYINGDTNVPNRNQLFKVTYIGTSNGVYYYSIRPMTNNGMGVSAPKTKATDKVDIQTMSTSESINNIYNYQKWIIASDGSYYTIRNTFAEDAYLSTPDSSTNGLQMLMETALSDNGRWIFEEFTEKTLDGIAMQVFKSSIKPNESYNCRAVMYSSTIGCNGPVTFTVTDRSGNATDKATIGSTTGVFRAIEKGAVQIRTTYSGAPWLWLWNVDIETKSIIIVPGIMGSNLAAGDNNPYAKGTLLWDSSVVDFTVQDIYDVTQIDNKIQKIFSLKCNSDGSSLYDVTVIQDKYGFGNTYKSLYDSLEAEYSEEYEIRFFAYDWRLSNETTANLLNDFIIENDYDKVILVCHSMGGLVASSYLTIGTAQRNKVEKIITLGSPLLGTPTMPYMWGSEDLTVLGYFTTEEAICFSVLLECITGYNLIDSLIGNFESLYEMFPSEKYFNYNYAGETYLYTSLAGASILEITTYSETKQRLEAYLPKYNSTLANNAENFHNSLYSNSEHITSLVDTYYIAGYNTNTIKDVEYNMWDWYIYTNTLSGDEMVPTWSATLGEKYSQKTFYVKGVKHTGLVFDSETINFVKSLIKGDTSVSSYSKIYTDMD